MFLLNLKVFTYTKQRFVNKGSDTKHKKNI